MVENNEFDPAADALAEGLAAMGGGHEIEPRETRVTPVVEVNDQGATDHAPSEIEAEMARYDEMIDKGRTKEDVEMDMSVGREMTTIADPLPTTSRRRAHRYPAKWRIRGQVLNGRAFDAYSEDVSSSGLLLSTPTRLPIGTRAYIKLYTYCFGVARNIVVEIEVKHASLAGDTHRAGAKFVTIKDRDAKFFDRYVLGANPHARLQS